MVLPVVAGVDGSGSSLRAVEWAADAAARHGTPLRLLCATGPPLGEPVPGLTENAERIRDTAVAHARARAPGTEVSGGIVPEGPAEALLCAGRNAFTLVVGSHGGGGVTGMLLGSVGLAVAGRADCPVVVVRGEPDGGGPVVLGVQDERPADESPSGVPGVEDTAEGRTAGEYAFREAHRRGRALIAVHAWRVPAGEAATAARGGGDGGDDGDTVAGRCRIRAGRVLDEALGPARERYPAVPVERRAVEGSARRALLEASRDAGLLVVGAHARRGHFGLQLGLVNHAVLHHAPCPVAVVPQA
ncbi:universal stress protein [Streptomyces zingiberis]|uniref:Universal stress protein n=1 Tax=Streptomyces zingiberis TaxID=2053010 RepID=A0ABX1BWP1_9ACTN|nr:universal stress protein [Streptomyces zingiberis]NJQ00157.1 universal stress protein [Streptomyces zingiberis]